MKVDTSPRLDMKFRFQTSKGWRGPYSARPTKERAYPSGEVHGFYCVPGVGIAEVEVAWNHRIATVLTVKANVAYGRYSACAIVVGTDPDAEDDLIVMAARAALAEAKRTNRKRGKKKSGGA